MSKPIWVLYLFYIPTGDDKGRHTYMERQPAIRKAKKHGVKTIEKKSYYKHGETITETIEIQ